jgi:hypothetical protein
MDLLDFGRLDLDPGGKMNHKKTNSIFLSAVCCLLRAEGFFCSLDLLHGGRQRKKLLF